MSRSVKDSDDDFEPKPGSESDSSISSIQTTRSTRTRTATMDSTASDTTKKLRTRKHSISSEISEIDIDIPQTPVKRTTRQSSGTASLVSTPTRVNTRATSKRFMRAGSETKSPLPATRITRNTRARSIDPESLTENKNQSNSPNKIHRRASVLPSSSQIKEQTELSDRIPYVRLDSTIVEADEITNSGNSDSSPDKALQRLHQIKRKLQNIVKDKVEEDYSHENLETSTDSSKSDEISQLSEKKDATQTEDNITGETAKNTENTLDKEQKKFEETAPSDKNIIEEFSTHPSPNHRNSTKGDTKIVENLPDIEKSLLDICESNKEMEVMPENLSGTSIEEEKSNKENQMLNIISDVAEKLMQPKPTSSIKSFTSPFMNKLLSEKETKSMKKELNLNKKCRSRESTEVSIKHSDLSKETIDISQEKMDISIESINSSASDKTILIHDSIMTEVVDKVTNKDEISTKNTSAYNEDAMEIISELEKTDTKECTITDNKNSNKIKSNEVDKTSRLSINLITSKQISDSRESLASIITADDDKIKLILEEQSPHRSDNKVSPNVAYSKPDQSVDLQILSPINKTSAESATVIDKQSALTQDKTIVIDSSDSIEQEQENLLKQETESMSQSSDIVLETNNSACNDSNDAVIQDNQLTDVIEASKKSTMDISFEKTDLKDILSEKVKPNLKRKSTDNLEGEKECLQMEMTQKDQEKINVADDVSDVNVGINLFQDIPADKWKEKNDDKTGSMQSTSQLVEEVKNENEAEHDLILMDRQAWLAAETIKAANEAESFEYDSDDTVLLKSRLDASQTNYDIEKLVTIDEEIPVDIDFNEKNGKQVKKRKSRTKKRLVSEIDEEISRYTENEDNLMPVDKSLNESKTALNRTNDRSISRLNKSEQSGKTKRRSSKASELDKEIEDDANELNRSSLISKNNISLRKSTGKRTSLNKSLKDISMQNISPSKSQIDNSEKEFDDTAASTKKKLHKKKHSLDQSCTEDTDDDATKSEKKNVATEDCSKKRENTSLNHSVDQESEPTDTRKTIHLNDDGSDDSDISVNIVAMNLGSKTYSMIANMGSDSDECITSRYSFTKANSESNTDDSNGYSDSLNREYNLDGLKLKFSDDDVPADECRDSEVEFSDSDDNGSDLEGFIVDDIEAENEEDNDIEAENEKEENDEEDNDIEAENDDEEDNENDDNVVQKEKVEDEKEKANFNTELINIENKDNEDVQKKDTADKDTNQNKSEMEAVSLYASTSHKLSKTHENKNISIEHISPCRSETETKQDIKMKKSSMRKNEKSILQDSSNSDLSIKKKKKKKSLTKENETILFNTCNLISSSLKKKSILDPQYSKDGAEQNLSEQLNKFKSTSAKLSELNALMELSIPDFNSCKKLELDETLERIPENKANKSNSTFKTTQNISVKDKSKKALTLNKDISLKKFKDANKKKISSDFSPNLLEKLEETSPSKLFKIVSRKTMNIEIETPRLKYLRKEKLNESAPTKLEYSTETNSLQKQLSAEKDTTQIKIKEKNKDKVHDLIIPSNDDVIQKCSQKKQKKRKRQELSNKNMSDEALSEDIIELNVPKKKKVKLTPLTIVEDNIPKDACEINKKKKKKDKLKANITDKAENAIELNISKKKKPVKLTQLSVVEDNTLEDVSLSHSDEKQLKQYVLMKYIIREAWSKDITKLKSPKKKKRDKLIQLPIVEDNIREDVYQINERKKKKKKQDISKEHVIDKPLATDVIEIKIPKKKKRTKLTQLSIVEDNTCEDACQINKIKKKKKQINIVEENTNVNKDNMLRNIRGNRTELPQHKKKNKIVNSLELDLLTDKQEKQVKKKIKRQETVENIETLRTENKKKKKKKKEEDTLPVQIPVSRLKSEKILLSNKLRLQKTALGMNESKNVACNTKELDETDAKVYTEESRSKKKRNRNEDVENAIYVNIPTKKSKKEIKEESKFLLPSSGLKQLPDDVIENLADVPTKAKKRQKTSRNKEKIVSSATTSKVKVTTADRDNTLNTSGCTTQFSVVNLQETKKQSKETVTAASFRKRMLTRNNREPMSSYLMFCEKMSQPK
ncbi:hypothetical protein ALC60_05584 [Trachymyrmex zeteki]|uniref:Uncharacterized protein n=1 Tax=Mycetomoellerius zeteki TaxID=64791 RepID=A0A151X541_9HYME|nr:PREDICTED: putative leucine-rich repeat-containing protein DDB_G0290503 isoform X2 [Trachymyrmex zeteki]KYQ55522.1 hypothetical protein ALC60_05584 [Trachymyrmex zeteki]